MLFKDLICDSYVQQVSHLSSSMKPKQTLCLQQNVCYSWSCNRPQPASYSCKLMLAHLITLRKQREFDFTLVLGCYFYRIYSHRTDLISVILICKMLHIKPLKMFNNSGNSVIIMITDCQETTQLNRPLCLLPSHSTRPCPSSWPRWR